MTPYAYAKVDKIGKVSMAHETAISVDRLADARRRIGAQAPAIPDTPGDSRAVRGMGEKRFGGWRVSGDAVSSKRFFRLLFIRSS